MGLERMAGMVRRATRLCLLVGCRYQADHASAMAASLSYTSLLSLVPLMAIVLAMLAVFPAFEGVRANLEGWAFANFVPAVGEAVQDQLAGFVANAGRLSAAGIVGLAFSAVMLLVTIENALDQVFRVPRARPLLARLAVYWALLTLGPLLIGASLSLEGWQVARDIAAWAAWPLPTLLSALAFWVMYGMVPNRKVDTLDAAIGGIAASLLFAALRWGFAVYLSRWNSYSNVYGAMAAVPIFLVWMYLSWVVVLIGAEITAALPDWRAGKG